MRTFRSCNSFSEKDIRRVQKRAREHIPPDVSVHEMLRYTFLSIFLDHFRLPRSAATASSPNLTHQLPLLLAQLDLWQLQRRVSARRRGGRHETNGDKVGQIRAHKLNRYTFRCWRGRTGSVFCEGGTGIRIVEIRRDGVGREVAFARSAGL